ncbi:gamma-glutamylcyclotransferase family protein [Saccharopolyspora mangrovi]|uniref:Gamma-glutamylcyclotransferase family protein n=1 Tax=Saccharopolyspora mangrovi TaxID=3082379 RepID=A0ABU6ACE0_9PSEU|nr:gamma-glutamylcyclotransferase family protein [Saccharopolyspora sp. S2-29]MEB3369205.1 gamma-glutamylcyclotransferase family protein [Saccharopolyspora sp. S2-29]
MSDRIAVYGTLQHGSSAWHLLEPLVTGPFERVGLPGTLYDTGRGYPALRLGGDGRVPAQVFRLRDPDRAWVVLDDYEGPEYERRLVTTAGEPCWVYTWPGPVHDLRPLPHGWPPG